MSNPTPSLRSVASDDSLTPSRYAPETVALAKRIIAEHDAWQQQKPVPFYGGGDA